MAKFKRKDGRINNKPPKNNGNGKSVTVKNNKRNGNGKLTAKQQKFVDEYLIDLNATQAAIRAGYSKKTAKVIGCENLTKLSIQTAIEKGRKKQAEKAGIDAQWILNSYKKLVDYDAADVFDDDGNLKPVSEMSPNARFAITQIKTFNKKTIKELKDDKKSISVTKGHDAKFHNKKDTLDKLGEYAGLFPKDGQQQGGNNFNGPVQINVNLTDD